MGDRAIEPDSVGYSGGSAHAFSFIAQQSGTASAISVYLAGANRARSLHAGLYADTSTGPGARLASGTMGKPRPGAWNTVQIPNTRVRAGSTYWIVILGTGGKLYLRERNSGHCQSPHTSHRHTLPHTWTGPPATHICPTSTYASGKAATSATHSPTTGGGTTNVGPGGTTGGSSNGGVTPSGVAHYLYAVTEGGVGVFDIDRGFAQVGTISLSATAGHGVRGVAASPGTHTLYVSYGSDSGSGGSLLAYDLVAQKVLWTKSYSHGIDSMAITPDGKTIYMPDGELSSDGKWYVVNAATGAETGAVIDTGAGTGDNGPHNTIVSLDGQHVFMGDRNFNAAGSNYFYEASTSTNQITQKVGPFKSGIRPFTVNQANTLVYTSVTGYKGFQVGDLSTGKILYSAPITTPGGTSCPNSGASDPSHGVSLSPDEKQLYVIDWPCNGVAVFDVSGVPASAPRQIAWIPVHSFNPYQSPCTYDCLGDGWLLHSSDGRYVFVGDSGDVIDTATQKTVANIPQLYQTRVFIEIDWANGTTASTTTRSGMGH